jgi:hypothetical protein
MKFFQTSDGRLHGGRIAGFLYVISLVLGCRELRVLEPSCLMQILFTMGWWLSFCGKRPRTLSEMAQPAGIIGVILILLGLAGQFYFVGRH